MRIVRYRRHFIGFEILGRKLLWDALTARAIRLSKKEG